MRILVKQNQNRLIPVLLDGATPNYSSSPSIPPRVNKSREVFGSSPPFDEAQGRTIDNRLDIVLAGENASVEIIGLVIGKGSDERNLETYITHAAARTKSRVIVKSVLRNKSTFCFRGNVKIEKGAKGSDAYLRSDALLFDDAKMGDDTPALEILEPDVKAGHAATIGK